MSANDLDRSAAGVSGLNGFVFDPSNLNKLDPLFADMVIEDFHLQPASPCVDSGNSSVEPLLAMDIEGPPRVVNEAVDMGAYKYQGGLPPPKPDLLVCSTNSTTTRWKSGFRPSLRSGITGRARAHSRRRATSSPPLQHPARL